MKKLYFEDVEYLCLDIVDKFENFLDKDNDISVLAKYEIAKEVVSELCLYYEIQSIHIERPDWDFYEDEYLVSVNYDGIWCMPVKTENGYLSDDNTILYVHEDCNSKALNSIKGNIVVEFAICELDCECDEECLDCEDECDFDEEFECDGDCENYELDELEPSSAELAAIVDEEDNLHGFTYSKSDDDSYHSVSYHSTEKLNNDRFKELMKMFGI